MKWRAVGGGAPPRLRVARAGTPLLCGWWRADTGRSRCGRYTARYGWPALYRCPPPEVLSGETAPASETPLVPAQVISGCSQVLERTCNIDIQSVYIFYISCVLWFRVFCTRVYVQREDTLCRFRYDTNTWSKLDSVCCMRFSSSSLKAISCRVWLVLWLATSWRGRWTFFIRRPAASRCACLKHTASQHATLILSWGKILHED